MIVYAASATGPSALCTSSIARAIQLRAISNSSYRSSGSSLIRASRMHSRRLRSRESTSFGPDISVMTARLRPSRASMRNPKCYHRACDDCSSSAGRPGRVVWRRRGPDLLKIPPPRAMKSPAPRGRRGVKKPGWGVGGPGFTEALIAVAPTRSIGLQSFNVCPKDESGIYPPTPASLTMGSFSPWLPTVPSSLNPIGCSMLAKESRARTKWKLSTTPNVQRRPYDGTERGLIDFKVDWPLLG